MQPSDQDFYRQVLESLPVGVFVTDRGGKIIFWNDGAERITGRLRQDVLGHHCGDEFLQHTDVDNQLLLGASVPLLETLREARALNARISIKNKSGHFVPVQLQTVPLRDSFGAIHGAIEIFEETTSLSLKDRRRDKLRNFGCLDTTTGVLNNRMILAHIQENLALFTRRPVPFCIACIAIDDLVKIRERFGQAAVDAVLYMVSQTIQNGLRPTDFVGCGSEHELVAILTECSETEVVKVIERLRKLVHFAGVDWWGDTLHVTVSAGATPAYERDSVESILARAQQALREVSGPHGNPIVVIRNA